MAHAPIEDDQPWYKQFWPWFLIALPASAVVGSMITIKMAVDTSDGLVKDNYYKEGLAINKDITMEKTAQALGITAQLSVDTDTREMRISLGGKLSDPPKMVNLEIFHPTRSKQDHQLQLLSIGSGSYVGRLPELGPANWRLSISPPNNEWRIKGRLLQPAEHTATLQ